VTSVRLPVAVTQATCDVVELTPIGKPPPLAVRLEQALPFQRCVPDGKMSCGRIRLLKAHHIPQSCVKTTQPGYTVHREELGMVPVVPATLLGSIREVSVSPLQGVSVVSTPL